VSILQFPSGHPTFGHDRPMTATPRQRARAQAIEDIKRIAKQQLALEGGAAVSLRAIARELGIVSSAVYRYVPSRDDLLTMLIIDAHNALADAVEAAEAGQPRHDLAARWHSIGHAVRDWALAWPAEYALIHGTPIPGYQGPTTRPGDPATRVPALLLALLADVEKVAPSNPLPRPLGPHLTTLRDALALPIGDDVLARGHLVWSALFGLVSFELRGRAQEHVAHFDHQLGRLAVVLGL
jgi:AcrR family transcriptional regulator